MERHPCELAQCRWSRCQATGLLSVTKAVSNATALQIHRKLYVCRDCLGQAYKVGYLHLLTGGLEGVKPTRLVIFTC
eukprot:6233079-Pyramimonas_sp.AAC.2